MHFGPDAGYAHRFVTGLLGRLLDELDGAGRRRALAGLRASLEAHETADGVLYESAARLITAGRT
ncbi:hypothetical protein [Streptomyces sp. GC420]|uniref:hypothetical protein n=1 Tax=Streptomyces sp. GC420 TaxID=2697568 RepID=UPI001414F6E4|nr:hypothetical protein [Streptomyces sp. GC420]NBM17389.1 hypothetical protein [Streptomyces sp. GC420]